MAVQLGYGPNGMKMEIKKKKVTLRIISLMDNGQNGSQMEKKVARDTI